jgi:hypothetical protein
VSRIIDDFLQIQKIRANIPLQARLGAGAPEEIELTEEMIEADIPASHYFEVVDGERHDGIVRTMFAAMVEVPPALPPGGGMGGMDY